METITKEHNVVMLATEDGSILHLWRDSNGVRPALCDKEYSNTRDTQHLYFTSDEEIKEGDYCLFWKDVEVHICKAKKDITNKDFGSTLMAVKIIATTNHKLRKSISERRQKIPQIPQSFIEEYIKNPVDKVELECETKVLMPPADVYQEEITYLKLTNNEVVVVDKFKDLRETYEKGVIYTKEDLENKVVEGMRYMNQYIIENSTLKGQDAKHLARKWVKENI